MNRKHTKNDLFLTAKQKSASDYKLVKEMIDTVDGLLGTTPGRIHRINENWHLHAGEWPEMDALIGKGAYVMKDEDGEGRSMNLDDFIVHHPKINNITNFIMGDIIMQPLIPIVKDFSAYGRKYREEQQVNKLRQYYYENMYLPQAQAINEQYKAEYGITDMLTLNPEEQRQAQSDLQKRYKAQIPRQVIEDLQRINTPDEKIKQVLLNYDIKAYDIEEKFISGGEQAVVAFEEYYKLGMQGYKPTLDVLNAKWTTWAADEEVDNSEDGIMAKYEQYLGIHRFVTKYGRDIVKKRGAMKEIKEYFSEIPGYFKSGHDFKDHGKDDAMMRELELDFVDAIGANPNLVQNDWRTREGQQEIAGLYNALRQQGTTGWGVPEVYTVFRWTERMTYVMREEEDQLQEYFFSADYARNPSLDIEYRQFPVTRVYHGTKVANKFYVGVEPVPWQFFGGVYDYDPKLTIVGQKYARSNGIDKELTLMCPAKQYQFRYNVSASRLEELEKHDHGKVLFWNRKLRPTNWDDADYIESIVKVKNVPYEDNQLQNEGTGKPPIEAVDLGQTSKMQEYRLSMDMWEREMYKAMYVNKDTLGQANQYQSNALTQSNIQGSQKQLLSFHNKRRRLKERVLNYFSNLSLIGLLEDSEKQAALFDDFSRLHLQVNRDKILGNLSPIFIVDDFDEAQQAIQVKQNLLALMQKNGTSLKDILSVFKSKSIAEMEDVAEVAEIKATEREKEAMESRREEIQLQNEGLAKAEEIRQQREDMRKERENQIRKEVATIQSEDKRKGRDVNDDGVPDSLDELREKIASEERMLDKKLAAEAAKVKKESA